MERFTGREAALFVIVLLVAVFLSGIQFGWAEIDDERTFEFSLDGLPMQIYLQYLGGNDALVRYRSPLYITSHDFLERCSSSNADSYAVCNPDANAIFLNKYSEGVKLNSVNRKKLGVIQENYPRIEALIYKDYFGVKNVFFLRHLDEPSLGPPSGPIFTPRLGICCENYLLTFSPPGGDDTPADDDDDDEPPEHETEFSDGPLKWTPNVPFFDPIFRKCLPDNDIGFDLEIENPRENPIFPDIINCGVYVDVDNEAACIALGGSWYWDNCKDVRIGIGCATNLEECVVGFQCQIPW